MFVSTYTYIICFVSLLRPADAAKAVAVSRAAGRHGIGRRAAEVGGGLRGSRLARSGTDSFFMQGFYYHFNNRRFKQSQTAICVQLHGLHFT